MPPKKRAPNDAAASKLHASPGKRTAAAGKANGKGKGKATASDLRALQNICDDMRSAPAAPDITDLDLEDDVWQVVEMTDGDVKASIEAVMLQLATTILAGNGFTFSIPSRSATNQLYIPDLDRIVLKRQLKDRAFANTKSVRKTSITTRVLELIHQVFYSKMHSIALLIH